MVRWLRNGLIVLAAALSLHALVWLADALSPEPALVSRPVLQPVGHTLVFRCYEPQPGLPGDCRGTDAEWMARLKRD